MVLGIKMQLICPSCGEPIKAEKINVQDRIAVCSACDNVFQFELPEKKAKRRKVHQPDKLILIEDDHILHMAYRTNFRLDANEAFLTSIFGTLFLAAMAVISSSELASGESTFIIPIMFAMISAVLAYRVGLVTYNKTHITMDDQWIRATRKPLPSLFNADVEVSLSDVTAITCDETPISKKEGYDTPRFNVWAERVDGSRRVIVTDVIENYGMFIAQRLNEHLNSLEDAEMDVNTSRLIETQQDDDIDDYQVDDLLTQTSNKNHK